MIIIKLAGSASCFSPGYGVARAEVPLAVLLALLLHALPKGSAQTGTSPDAPVDISSVDPKTALIMFLAAVLFFVVMGFCLYTRECMDRRRSGEDQTRVAEPRRRRPRRGGLQGEVIRSFPTFSYSTVKAHKIGKSALECAVCLNEFEDDDILRFIPLCSHVFHPDCIDEWLRDHRTCPVCRVDLTPKLGERVSFQLPEPTETEISGVEQRVLGSPDEDLINSVVWTNPRRPPRSRSTGWSTWRITGWLPRSISTGHTLVQQPRNPERFTLRLPEEVRLQLVRSNVAYSATAFPQTRSPKRGFRSGSVGSSPSSFPRGQFGRKEDSRTGQQHRRAFSLNSPFWKHSTPHARSPSSGGSDQVVSAGPPTPSVPLNSPLWDRVFKGKDEIGERSSDRLWPGDQV